MIRLEPVGPRHVPRMQELVAHPDVLRTTRLPDPYPADGAARFVEAVQVSMDRGEEFVYAVIAEDEGLVGTCGLHDIDRSSGTIELGYWIGRAYWGRGYASAAAREAARVALTELGFTAVVAHALEDNVASRRVLENAGFVFQGLGRHSVAKWPAERQVALYRIGQADLADRTIA
jgi:RimJ/RimL family protein N-acetyltransferase